MKEAQMSTTALHTLPEFPQASRIGFYDPQSKTFYSLQGIPSHTAQLIWSQLR